LALVALGALSFLYVSSQLSTAVPVIAVVNDVQRGAVIKDADVGVANVVPDPALAPVRAHRIDEVVGLRAATDLVSGTLLADASVTAGVVPATGESVVGVPLMRGQKPGELNHHGFFAALMWVAARCWQQRSGLARIRWG
jgi:flagella basal body P-ring formation protein FlgA